MVLLTSSASFHPTQLLSRRQSTPVTPLLATLTKITGCVPTIPILGLNALRFTSSSVSTFRRADVQTFRRTNCPPVPNRTVQDPLPYAYNVWAIPTSPCPGDRPFLLSWRSL